MAADLLTIKDDLDRVDDTCLDEVRRVLDNCLHISPEDDRANQAVQQVLTEYLSKKDIFVRVSTSSKDNVLVATSNTASPGFIPTILWLFIWANKRKG